MKFPQHAVVETTVAAARYSVFNTFAMALVHLLVVVQLQLAADTAGPPPTRRTVAPRRLAREASPHAASCHPAPPRTAFGAFDCNCVTLLRGSCIVNVLTCELAGAAAANGDCGCCCCSGSGSCWAAAS